MKEEINLVKEYNELLKKHKLPKFEELNDDFELEFIKEKQFLLRQIRRRISEKIIFFCRIIEGLIYPTQQHIISATESGNFSDEKKKEMQRIYKELMQYERESLSLDVMPDDKKDVEFINEVFMFWKKTKKNVYEIVKKMRESWGKEYISEKDNYFG